MVGLGAIAVLTVVIGRGAAGAAGPSATGWTLPNLSRASTRAVAGSPINAGNVGQLARSLAIPLHHSAVLYPGGSPEAIRGVVATPIVVGRHGLHPGLDEQRVRARPATGALRWVHRFRAPNFGRNGLSYSSGSVYGDTDTTAFALSAQDGPAALVARLSCTGASSSSTSPRCIANDLVYTSTVGYPPDGRGAIYALDAHSGPIAGSSRRFATRGAIRRSPEAGAPGTRRRSTTQGNVYWGVANPYPLGGTPAKFPNGERVPGPVLYTDSLVVLDGKTGRLRWYDQVTPHDVRDYDFQLPPILASLAAAGAERHVDLRRRQGRAS